MVLELKEIAKILAYLSLVISVFGFIGNVLIFFVYRRPIMKKTSVSLYFQVNVFVENFIVLNMIRVSFIRAWQMDLRFVNDFFCKTAQYSVFAIGAISPWILVAVSIDRFLAIAYPKRFKLIYTEKFKSIYILSLFIFNILLYSPQLWFRELRIIEEFNQTTNQTISIETICYSENLAFIWWFDLFNAALFPFLFMIIISSCMVYVLFKSRKKFKSLVGKDKRKSSKDRKFAITLITLNLVFLILNLPVIVYSLVADYFIQLDPVSYGFYFYVSAIFYYSNYATSFLVQFLTNNLFRNEVYVVLCIRNPPLQENTSFSNTTKTKNSKY
jgi:hypothetical protein